LQYWRLSPFREPKWCGKAVNSIIEVLEEVLESILVGM